MAKRKPTTAAKPSVMKEDRFWKLIERARQNDDFIVALTANLKELPADDVIGFQNTLQRKLADAYTFPCLRRTSSFKAMSLTMSLRIFVHGS